MGMNKKRKWKKTPQYKWWDYFLKCQVSMIFKIDFVFIMHYVRKISSPQSFQNEEHCWTRSLFIKTDYLSFQKITWYAQSNAMHVWLHKRNLFRVKDLFQSEAPRRTVCILRVIFYFTDYNSSNLLTSKAAQQRGLINKAANIDENI